MRDVVITLIVLGSIPFIFKRPSLGIVMWVWISVMNPHRLSWGFAFNFPFAALIAAVTIVAMILTKQPRKLPMTPIVITLILFTLWMCLTTAAAMWPAESAVMLNRVSKTMLMTLVTIMLIKNAEDVKWLVWTLAASIGYYGVKGGIFTVMTGASSIVWGPAGTYIEGNNEVALAFITIIPIMYYMYLQATNKWMRMAMLASCLLCAAAALGSYSRGALLGIAAMAFFLWLKSPKKAVVGIVMVCMIPIAVAFMPDKWGNRMETINTYEQDASAMGRIKAWHMAFNLAKDRPLGGGFEIYNKITFAMYAPVPELFLAAHSIYFQALGEHGFIGLFIYLLLGGLTWRKATWIVKMTATRPDYKWAGNLALMIQVSLVGFATGGAFLSLLYYDVPYYLIACVVSVGGIIDKVLADEKAAARNAAKAAPPQALPIAS